MTKTKVDLSVCAELEIGFRHVARCLGIARMREDSFACVNVVDNLLCCCGVFASGGAHTTKTNTSAILP